MVDSGVAPVKAYHYASLRARFSAERAASLVNREESALETATGHAQIEAPDAQPFGASEAHRVVEVLVEPLRPVAQCLGVIVAELLDVAGDEAGPLERQQHAREMQRFGIGEDVALRERSGLGVAVAEASDAVVEQAPTRLEQAGQGAGVDVDLGLANVLDHADAGDRVEALAGQVAVIHHP